MSETVTMEAAQVQSGTRQTMVVEGGMKPYDKDQYGNRLNTEPARINAALDTYARTAAQIGESCGLSEKRVSEHLKYWLAKSKGVGLAIVKSQISVPQADGTEKLVDVYALKA